MLKQGDIIKLDFNTQSWLALVISNDKYHKISQNRAWVCPIALTDRDYPIHIRLDEHAVTRGVVLCDQIKTIDTETTKFEFIEVAPDNILQNSLDIINGLIT